MWGGVNSQKGGTWAWHYSVVKEVEKVGFEPICLLRYKVENKNKQYIQENRSSFSQSGAVVTLADSDLVFPGSNPRCIYGRMRRSEGVGQL